ncbi:hypothetical protein MTR_1g041545 [Medicago truncatula]|uniref:Uncharacterized protein n=1 Tax=Medicago truncatula TaxID=3880 RepID=A0A072VI10_MEDTR|nr:hypothetical protein MTR_1g041545 [Medicago truncatula]
MIHQFLQGADDDSTQNLSQISNSFEKTFGLIHQLYHLTVSTLNVVFQMSLYGMVRIKQKIVKVDVVTYIAVVDSLCKDKFVNHL